MALQRPSLLFSLPSAVRSWTCLPCRSMHKLNMPSPRIPPPTPFVPDARTFLTLIGRGMSQHAAKIPSWEALFSLTSQQLREAGMEPARARRYLMWWRERYRNGIMGIGGDLKEVKDGIAELRIVEVPSSRPIDQPATLIKSAGMRKMVINVMPTVVLPPDPANPPSEEDTRSGALSAIAPPRKLEVKDAKPVAGVKIVHANIIAGSGVELVKGHHGVARLKVKDGLWEQKRGHKIDGGERRKAEVRYKKRLAERKNAG